MKKGGKEEPGEEKGKGLSGHRKWAHGLALLPVSQGTGHRWWGDCHFAWRSEEAALHQTPEGEGGVAFQEEGLLGSLTSMEDSPLEESSLKPMHGHQTRLGEPGRDKVGCRQQGILGCYSGEVAWAAA